MVACGFVMDIRNLSQDRHEELHCERLARHIHAIILLT